jgi:hypothetical protein
VKELGTDEPMDKGIGMGVTSCRSRPNTSSDAFVGGRCARTLVRVAIEWLDDVGRSRWLGKSGKPRESGKPSVSPS